MSENQKKAGRPRSTNPKTEMIYVRTTVEEKLKLEAKAKSMNLTLSELLIKGALEFK